MLRMLGTYRVEEKLADGGMGSVFLGRAPDGRKVVLKVPLAQDREAAVALADEARTGARLRHPAIVETLDFFVDAGRSVLVVAFVDGPTLLDLRRAGPLPPSAVAEVGVQLAGALQAIHAATDEAGRPLHMLHRDISPNNVLVDRSGQVRLIDLGIARSADRRQQATLAGMVKGTLRYLAPEILRGGEHSVASDIWALGVTLWEAAMARHAVAGDPMNTMRAALDGSILALSPDEHVDRDVHEVIGAFACPPESRIQNARAAGAVLARLCVQKPNGRAALAEAVAIVGTRALEDRTDNVDVTLVGERPPPRVAPAVAAREPASDDVASVFTTTMPRDQISAATVQMPALGAPKPIPKPIPKAVALDGARVDGLPKPLAGVRAPPKRAEETEVAAAPTLMQMPRVAVAKPEVSAEAKTILQMPAAAPVPIVSQEGGPEAEPEAEDIDTAATIQMPAWDGTNIGGTPAAKPARELPKPSLFLPIVVVDEDGEELP